MKVKARNPREITTDLFRRLRLRNQNNGVVVLCEVGDGAGFSNRGWTDAVSMQSWPSKGLVISGYEIKATRADWLRELDRPEKNATWQTQADEWYVIAPTGVVEVGELPPNWGLMIPSGKDGLRIASRAWTAEPEREVKRGLVAAIFRAAANEQRRLTTVARLELMAEAETKLGEQLERERKEAREYRDKYEQLASALGGRWQSLDNLKSRAEAVVHLEQLDDGVLTDRLRRMKSDYETKAAKVSELIDETLRRKAGGE